MSKFGFPGGALLRVTALQPIRRRAGLAFHQSEPRDLTPDDLGTGLGAIMSIAAILGDPLLSTVLVQDGEERQIIVEERDSLLAFLGTESSKVDAEAPPPELKSLTEAPLAGSSPATDKPAPAEPAPTAQPASAPKPAAAKPKANPPAAKAKG